MTCPHCSSARTAARKRRTSLGYRTFACHDCRRTCNEHTARSMDMDSHAERELQVSTRYGQRGHIRPTWCATQPPQCWRHRFARL